MNIKFNNIIINNFLSFEKAELQFNNNGFTLVKGYNNNIEDLASSNGSGKSSIWEAIVWCLSGETIRGTKDVKNLFTDGKTEVTLDFNIDDKNYKLIRTKDPSNLKLFVDGQDVSAKGIRDTEKKLAEYIPDLTSSLIGSVIILGQGLPQRFSNNTPSGRKEVLEKLSKSDFMIEDIKERISNRKSILADDLRKIQDTLLQANTKQQMLETKIAANTDKLSELESCAVTELSEQLVSSKSDLDNQTKELNDIENTITNLTDSISQNKINQVQLQADYQQKINSEGSDIQKDIENLRVAYAKLESEAALLNKEIRDKKNIKDVCPTCGQKLVGVVKPDTTELEEKVDQIKKDMLNIRVDLEGKGNQLESIKEAIDKEFDIKHKEINETIVRDNATLSSTSVMKKSIEDKINELSRTIADIEKTLSTIEADKARLEAEINSDNKQLSDIKDEILYNISEEDNIKTHADVISKMSTIIARDFRGYLLTNIIDYINTRSKEYSREVFNTDKLDFILDGNNIVISYCGKDYANLSGGERQKVDIIIQFTIRDMLCKFLNFSSNILVIDELFDNLDTVGCEKILNIISTQLTDVDSVYIITHHADIPLPCDNILTITKGADRISRITQS